MLFFNLSGITRERAKRWLGVFFDAVDSTLLGSTRQPGLGKATRFRHPELHGLRSFRVHAPFDAHLIFYRTTEHMLSVERLMHGARDLPRRLREPPGSI